MAKRMDVFGLARVVERSEAGAAVRSFKATTADGHICHVTVSREARPLFVDPLIFCHKHNGDECEGAFRVKLCMVDERLQKGLMSLVGFELRQDGKTEGAIEAAHPPLRIA